MNRFVSVFSALSLLIVTFIVNAPSANAQVCSTSSSFGSLQANITIPQSGTYIVWTRIQPVTAASEHVQIELNNNTCFKIGTSSTPLNSWTWLNFSGASSSNVMKYTFNTAGTYPIKMFGLSDLAKIDKVILIGEGETCSSNSSTPQGDGSNCDSAAVVTTPSGSNGTNPTPQPLTPAIVANSDKPIAKVSYFVNGALVHTADGAEALPLAGLPEGEHTLKTVVEYSDGTSAESSESLIIDSQPIATEETATIASTKSALNIWLKIFIGGMIALLVYLSAWMFMRWRYHKNLYLVHHGLVAHGTRKG